MYRRVIRGWRESRPVERSLEILVTSNGIQASSVPWQPWCAPDPVLPVGEGRGCPLCFSQGAEDSAGLCCLVNGIETCLGRGRWGLGTGSAPESGQVMEQAAQGNGHGAKLLEFKEHFDTTLKHGVGFWMILCRARS